VPRAQRLEVAILKAVANRYVMQRPGAQQEYARQRELVHELGAQLLRSAPASLEPTFRGPFDDAPDDGARLRVVVDQIASLTDTSVVAWHDRLCR
jgi:dGTPase